MDTNKTETQGTQFKSNDVVIVNSRVLNYQDHKNVIGLVYAVGLSSIYPGCGIYSVEVLGSSLALYDHEMIKIGTL